MSVNQGLELCDTMHSLMSLSFSFFLSFWELFVSRHRSSSLAGISDKSMSQKKERKGERREEGLISARWGSE